MAAPVRPRCCCASTIAGGRHDPADPRGLERVLATALGRSAVAGQPGAHSGGARDVDDPGAVRGLRVAGARPARSRVGHLPALGQGGLGRRRDGLAAEGGRGRVQSAGDVACLRVRARREHGAPGGVRGNQRSSGRGAARGARWRRVWLPRLPDGGPGEPQPPGRGRWLHRHGGALAGDHADGGHPVGGRGHLDVHPGGSHQLHRHPHADEFFLVLQGGGEHLTKDGPVRLNPGDLAYIPAGEWHGFQTDPGVTTRTVYGYLGAGSLAQAGYELLEEET
ncbi:cupin domain-containing protein [Cystobacter fuscus]